MHGIGGRTIAEARECITYREFISWIKYVKKHGSLNPALRLDRTLGIIATHFSRALGVKYEGGGKAERDNFTLYPEKHEDVEATPEQVFAYLSSIATLKE